MLAVCYIADNIRDLDVRYVCYIMPVQRFEPQGRHFTNFHCYFHYKQRKQAESLTAFVACPSPV